MTNPSKRRTTQRTAASSTDKSSKSSTSNRVENSIPHALNHTELHPLTIRNADDNSGFSSSDDSATSDLSSPTSEYGGFESIDKPDAVGDSSSDQQAASSVPTQPVPVEDFEQLKMDGAQGELRPDDPTDGVPGRIEMDIDTSASAQPNVTDIQTKPDQEFTDHKQQGQTVFFVVPTVKPTATGIIPDAFASERELPYVVGLMLAPDRPHATVVTVERSFPKEDDSELKRIRMLAAFKGNSKIRNLSLCDPTTLSLLDQRYLKHDSKENLSLFFLPGIIKFTSLLDDSQNSRQIGFLPIASTWYRALAVIGSIYQTPTVYFASFQNAITMSTKTRNASASSSAGSQPEGLTKFDGSSSMISPSDTWSLNFDAHVPIFDGRYRLNFNNLRECPVYCRELQPGAAVAPIFTVHSYHPYGAQLSKHGVQKTDVVVSFNIRALVYVKEPHPSFTHKQKVNARQEALGVTFPPVRGDVEDDEAVKKSSTTDDDDILGGDPMDTDLSAVI